MTFDFDTMADRRYSDSLKWRKYKGRDILPLWVADMDFKSPPAVIDAIKERAAHGVFGYAAAPRKLMDIIVGYLSSRFNWTVEPKWIVWLPGLVTGINVSCRVVGRGGDEILTAIPVYPPFLTAPGYSQRRLATVPLSRCGRIWTFDYERLESAVTSRTKMFILCNPHNPVGRVFTREELERLVDICRRHDLVICSDEIHNGLILDEGKPHIPTATISPHAAQMTITLMAPSKTYNIPGLGCSFAVIPNGRLRTAFKRAMAGIVPEVNIMGYAAAAAAYAEGDPWLGELIQYLKKNRDLVFRRINAIPGLCMDPVEATYLAWIDARELALDNPAAFFENGGIGLSDGTDFGTPGYVRLNFGCPRHILEAALNRMASAIEEIA